MTAFVRFAAAVRARYDSLAQFELFVTDVDDIFAAYLAAFPPGANPLHKTRTFHDCQCCKQFVRRLGALVAISATGERMTIWETLRPVEPAYAEVARRLHDVVSQAPIRGVFRSKERAYGTDHNFGADRTRYDHFSGTVHPRHFTPTPETARGELATAAQVFRRGLTEITLSDLDVVADLIQSNALYRGAEHLPSLSEFRALRQRYDGTDSFVWANVHSRAALFRNTVLGTLLVDLAQGVPLEDAVRMFEAKVAPANYKRPTALITRKMVEDAQAKLTELGLEGAVHRRYARLSDVSVRNVLFVDNRVRATMRDASSLTSILARDIKPKPIDPKKAHPISLDDFLRTVLPAASSLSALVENRHLGNFVSLTGGDGDERLFRWDNNFAWSYTGDVADSIKARVKRAGGNVAALLRVSLAWFNYDDLDIHAQLPDKRHVYYAAKQDILDVDMNAMSGKTRSAVENLAFKHLADGVYRIWVNQFAKRENVDLGFELELEYAGETHQWSYPKAVVGDVACLALTVKRGALVEVNANEDILRASRQQEKWGVKTGELVPVSAALFSPNHWDDNAQGARHLFLVLQGCANPDSARGIYNEFLRPELEKHRKVFEALGARTKCPPAPDQVSGLGFTSARGDSVTLVVDGARALNVSF